MTVLMLFTLFIYPKYVLKVEMAINETKTKQTISKKTHICLWTFIYPVPCSLENTDL